VEAINAAPKELKPKVLVSSSAIGYYGKRFLFVSKVKWCINDGFGDRGCCCMWHLFLQIIIITETKYRNNNTSGTRIPCWVLINNGLWASCAGTSESFAFDEASPSGKDYLAEVRNMTVNAVCVWKRITDVELNHLCHCNQLEFIHGKMMLACLKICTSLELISMCIITDNPFLTLKISRSMRPNFFL
jgi:hypothetical protein